MPYDAFESRRFDQPLGRRDGSKCTRIKSCGSGRRPCSNLRGGCPSRTRRRGAVRRERFCKSSLSQRTASSPTEEISQLSINEIELLLESEHLQRSQLEQLAIHRFGVPKGSMRKWSRKEELRDKVLTMLSNEQKHRTIGEVARSKLTSPSTFGKP